MSGKKKPLIKFSIITLFEDAIRPYLETSMMRKASMNNIVEFNFVNLRDFGIGPHKSVDDTPYGGGNGMLFRCEPVFEAVESIKNDDENTKVIIPTPAGEIWNQKIASKIAKMAVTLGGNSEDKTENISSDEVKENNLHLIMICPHYEGYDERILSLVDYKISLGNYILTGGELPVLIIIDSITRLLPNVLGGEKSAEIESFSNENADNIEFPQYTKPAEFRGMKVPEVLLSGHHEMIAKWRAENSKISKNTKI